MSPQGDAAAQDTLTIVKWEKVCFSTFVQSVIVTVHFQSQQPYEEKNKTDLAKKAEVAEVELQREKKTQSWDEIWINE